MNHLSIAMKHVSETYDSYSELFTDESDPHVAVSLKACVKISDFLKRISSIVAERGEEIRQPFAGYAKMLNDVAFPETERTLAAVMKHNVNMKVQRSLM